MAEYKDQDKDLIFALDIGTRSIVGVVGKQVDDRFKVMDIELAEHGKRYMLDGQIDDIEQVAALARTVTARLEERLGVRLQRVCVAAAGRALRTQSGSFTMELDGERVITAEEISRVETGAVTAAEEALQMDEESRQRFFLVGYTVSQYRLDNYPLTALQHHSGKKIEADVVATFLPGEVVESLYTAMRAAGLQIASMTLEPIAAMNAVIPADLRLLNLALVDIGAGTTDIAICKEGSVVGYTMVTVAGDEITEALMRALLVDFQTAEQIKRELREDGEVRYVNILGLEESTSCEEITAAIQEPMERLADAIAKQITALNGISPSAVYLAGGGSKLNGLKAKVANSLGMDERRVAIAGNNFAKSAFSEQFNLDNPEYATPLGIAISAGMGLLNDSYVVMLNGETAKLFRNGILTLRDILLMNGYSYGDMMGKTGKSLSITVDGKRLVMRGEPAIPAILQVNGTEASITTVIHAGDEITFVPAKHGAPAEKTLGELLGKNFNGRALVNNVEVPMDTPLCQGDVVLTLEKVVEESAPAPAPAPRPQTQPQQPVRTAAPAPQPAADVRPKPVLKSAAAPQAKPQPGRPKKELHIVLNDLPMTLAEKENGLPYYLMDLLQYSGIDFDHLNRPVRLEVNGQECGFRYVLQENDIVVICCV